MPGAVRVGQDIFGLGGRVIQGACEVLVNGKPAVRRGDIVIPHAPFKGKHKLPSPVTQGTCEVLADGRPMVRQGHITACLDPAVSGSCDVLIGDITAGFNPNSLPAGARLVDGAIVYDNTASGIQALANSERAVGESMAGYHEEAPGSVPGQDDPVPTAVPPEGCKNSRYFKVNQSKMSIVAQQGLTKEQIECNWIALCTNILDRLVDDGFNFSINSGFRTDAYNQQLGSSGSSDHSIGCAVDISGGPNATEFARRLFRHMLNNSNYAYSQLIYEGTWVHIAYNGRGPKGAARVMYTYSGRNPIVAGATGQNLPQDLRA